MLPVAFVWRVLDIADDDGVVQRRFVMDPVPRFRKLAGKQFAENGEYPLMPLESRNMAAHRGYFAAISEGFDNLPETIAARFPSSEHLRRWCLVECGYLDEREFDSESEGQARALAYFVRTQDEYARISIHGTKVIVRRAKSQSLAAMGAEEFKASKRAVLELLESMIGVRPGTLRK
jgi:hypothetical protein